MPISGPAAASSCNNTTTAAAIPTASARASPEQEKDGPGQTGDL